MVKKTQIQDKSEKKSKSPDLQRKEIDFENERLIKAIAESGLLTNFEDHLLIYEYENVQVLTRSGEYLLRRRINLQKREGKWRESTFWSTFYDSRVLDHSYNDKESTYTETRKKTDFNEREIYIKSHHAKQIDIVNLAKKIGGVVFKSCWGCGYSFPVRGIREKFCNECKEKQARISVRKYRDNKKKPEKDCLRDDDRPILSPVYGLIRCLNCHRLFPGVRAKYCPACKVAKWREKKIELANSFSQVQRKQAR